MKDHNDKWGRVFKNGPSKICGRQPLKIFTWSILEYFVPFVTGVITVFYSLRQKIEYWYS